MSQWIPRRAETLEILQLMGSYEPILLLAGDADDYGTRWTLHGQELPTAIGHYLRDAGFIAESGVTELGARTYLLTATGREFRDEGRQWWAGLSWFQRIRTRLFG